MVHLENSSSEGTNSESADEWDEEHESNLTDKHDEEENSSQASKRERIHQHDRNGLDHISKKAISAMKVKEPPVFQGEATSDVNRWLELIEDFMSCFTENEVMKVQKVMLYLGEGPRIFVKTAEQEAKKEGRPFLWKDVKQTLLECFLPTITEDIARMRLATLKQTGSVWEYTAEFQKLDRYIVNSDAADRIDRYRRGLKEQIQRMWLQQSTLQSATKATSPTGGIPGAVNVITKLTQAIAYAVQLEAAINQYRELARSTGQSSRLIYGQRWNQLGKAGVNVISGGDHDMLKKEVEDEWITRGYVNSDYDNEGVDEKENGRLNYANTNIRRSSPPKPIGMSDDKYRMLIRERKCLLCEQAGHRMLNCPKQSGSARASSNLTASAQPSSKNQLAPRQ